ncbi:MAG: ABC transporter permease [Firmicutes bacterium]|nr:ABC transporter permease [Bacillota bacterium]
MERRTSVVEPVQDDAATERLYGATQWQLMGWQFRKHKLAMGAAVVLCIFYLVALFAEFFSPHDPMLRYNRFIYAPPQRIRFVHEGQFQARPFVYGYDQSLDPQTLMRVYTIDTSKRYPVRFFTKGYEYKLLGLINTDIHFMGVEEPGGTLFLLGTDRLGRDLFSRILHGGRISLTMGLCSVFLSLFIGLLLGGLAGYYGGTIDNIIQRLIEILRSMPTIPLWMGLSAAVPSDWPPLKTYFAITIVLSIIGWTTLARRVRGRFLSLREEDFVISARLAGASELRIIFVHMLPSFMSHIIVSVTLSIPQMILGETALSFLGLGLRPPVISWGVLLKEAQNLNTIAVHPWLLTPALFVIAAVLAFNFVGDGLRDAADPYSHL